MKSRLLPAIDPAHARLIQARAKVMDRDIGLGEILCDFTFAEGARVVTLARDRAHIVYSPTFVAEAPMVDLVLALQGIARRASGGDPCG